MGKQSADYSVPAVPEPSGPNIGEARSQLEALHTGQTT